MPILLAAVSAAAYGVGDFFGGLSARRMPATATAVTAQLTGLVLLLGLCVVVAGSPAPSDLAWGAVAGTCGGVALTAFYWALATGQMSVVAPVSAVVAALVPFTTGLLLGERPTGVGVLGCAGALVAIALVSRTPAEVDVAADVAAGTDAADPVATRRRLVLAAALLSGIGFGAFFVAVAQTPDTAGLWPLVVARGVASTLVLGVALVARTGGPNRPGIRLAATAGCFDVIANALFLVAIRDGLLTLVGVIAAMYPASTVVLARVLLKERLARHQLWGLGVAAAAVAAIAVG